MRTIDVVQDHSNRNQSLRLLMLLIIVGTLPFYCFAIYFIGSAPVEVAATATPERVEPAPSFTPLGAEFFPTATAPAFASMTPLNPLPATPVQFVPPTPLPAQTIAAQTVVSPTPISPRATAPAGIADADLDGIADAQDRCPQELGFADNDGCPYADDPDRDGIRGAADLCPAEYAAGTQRGCRDQDDDGLDTSQDACPAQAGPAANRGCPIEGEAGG